MATGTQKRVNVLMIDDDPEAILLMGARLNEDFGAEANFILEGAETLKDGLSKLEKGDFDVILLGLGLPDSVGLDIVIAAKRKAGLTPIVVLTGFEDEAAGLGLAICREIAELSSGRIWLEPSAGRGARFHLELPRGSPSIVFVQNS